MYLLLYKYLVRHSVRKRGVEPHIFLRSHSHSFSSFLDTVFNCFDWNKQLDLIKMILMIFLKARSCWLWCSWGIVVLSGTAIPIFEVDLAHTSLITLKRCIQPHGECGRVVRWPSALGWWCRRRRACHSSCNWGGMPGLAGPFHLHPAVRWETQKIQELIMSLLGFCSPAWGWNHPPRPSSSSPIPLHATPTHLSLPQPPPPPFLLILQPL